MGACVSSQSTSTSKNMAPKQTTDKNMTSDKPESAPEEILPKDSNLEEFTLKKTPGSGCSGMFWRSDPTGQTQLSSGSDWPRDGAHLRGQVVEVDGEKWLLTTHVKQRNDKHWKRAPMGAAMPFEYGQYYLE